MAANQMPVPIRKARSLMLRISERLSSVLRILLLRLANDSIDIPWTTVVERDVLVRVTDGGSLSMAKGGSLGAGSRIVIQGGAITFGESVFVGPGCVMVAQNSIRIGARVLIAEYVTLRDQDHIVKYSQRIVGAGFENSPIEIGDDVWIGAKASVLRGSRIGAGSVVGVHSLIRGEVPPGAIFVGVPARLLRMRASHDD